MHILSKRNSILFILSSHFIAIHHRILLLITRDWTEFWNGRWAKVIPTLWIWCATFVAPCPRRYLHTSTQDRWKAQGPLVWRPCGIPRARQCQETQERLNRGILSCPLRSTGNERWRLGGGCDERGAMGNGGAGGGRVHRGTPVIRNSWGALAVFWKMKSCHNETATGNVGPHLILNNWDRKREIRAYEGTTIGGGGTAKIYIYRPGIKTELVLFHFKCKLSPNFSLERHLKIIAFVLFEALIVRRRWRHD